MEGRTVKLKVTLEQAVINPEGKQEYSITLSLTSSLDGVWWSVPRPGSFTHGKENPYPLYRKLGRCGVLPPPGFGPRILQLVASCYIDYAVPAPLMFQREIQKERVI